MSDSENINVLVKCLRTVPAKSLKLIELANEIPIVDGYFDPLELTSRQVDIKLAKDEAKMYGAATQSAYSALIELGGVNDVGPGPNNPE